jgi:hypothetical protein
LFHFDLIRCWVLGAVQTVKTSDVGLLTIPKLSVAQRNLGFTKFESHPDRGVQIYVLYVTAVFIE